MGKHDFLMMTAHVKSGEKPADLPAKVSQGQEVANIIADAGMPVIFACDFNNRPGGDAHNSFFAQLAKRKTNVTSAYSNVLDEWRCVEETDNTIKPEQFRNSRDHTRLSDAEKKTPEFCGTIQDPENPGKFIQNDDNRICPRCKQTGLELLAEGIQTKIQTIRASNCWRSSCGAKGSEKNDRGSGACEKFNQ